MTKLDFEKVIPEICLLESDCSSLFIDFNNHSAKSFGECFGLYHQVQTNILVNPSPLSAI